MPLTGDAKRKYDREYRARNKGRFRKYQRKYHYGFEPPPEPHRCDACKEPAAKFQRGLALDHDHVTGKFRGYLCPKCNVALGHVNDSRDRLQMLIDYLDNVELLK